MEVVVYVEYLQPLEVEAAKHAVYHQSPENWLSQHPNQLHTQPQSHKNYHSNDKYHQKVLI